MIPLPFVRGGFSALIADPPWAYRDRGSRAAPDYDGMSVAEICALPIEPLMADDAICLLWVTSAHCDLEPVSGSKLDGISAGVRVLNAWGFEHKATGVWVKSPHNGEDCLGCFGLGVLEVWNEATIVELVRCERCGGSGFDDGPPTLQVGMGHYVRHAHELYLVGRRGRFSIPPKHRWPSVFFAPRPPAREGQKRRHSTKPNYLHQWIDSFVLSEPRLELFARAQYGAGWRCWGNEVQNEKEEQRHAPQTGKAGHPVSPATGTAKQETKERRRGESNGLVDGESKRRRSTDRGSRT